VRPNTPLYAFVGTYALAIAANVALLVGHVLAGRALGPAGYGEAALIVYGVGVLVVLSSGAVGPVVSTTIAARTVVGHSGANVVSAGTFLVGTLVAPVTVVLVCNPAWVRPIIGPVDVAVIRLGGALLAALVAAEFLRSVLLGIGRPLHAWAVMATAATITPACIVLLGERLSVVAYLAVAVISQGAAPILAYGVLIGRRAFGSLTWPAVRETARLSFPLAAWGGSLLLGQWVTRRLVGAGDIDQAGLFQAASTFQQPFLLVATALTATLLPALSRERALHREPAIARRAYIICAVFALPASGVAIAVAEPVILGLFGSPYEGAITAAPPMIMASTLVVLAHILGQQLIAREHSGIGVAVNVAWCGILAATLWVVDKPTALEAARTVLLSQVVHTSLMVVVTYRLAHLAKADILVLGLVLGGMFLQLALPSLALPLSAFATAVAVVVVVRPVRYRRRRA
jgi:O-antigen/teichoic acid export membrane protein